MKAEIEINGLKELEKEITKTVNKTLRNISNDFYRNIQLYSPLGIGNLKKSWKLNNEIGQSYSEINISSELDYAINQNITRLRHPIPRDKIGTDSFTSQSPSKASTIESYRAGYLVSIRQGMYDTYEARYIEKAAEDAGLDLAVINESQNSIEYSVVADKKIQQAIDKIK